MQSKRNCTGAVIHVCFTKKEEKKRLKWKFRYKALPSSLKLEKKKQYILLVSYDPTQTIHLHYSLWKSAIHQLKCA